MINFRVGQGYDIHRLIAGRRLILAGVKIPFERGLDGHSDADVVAHAVMDSLLGPAALGDIGTHFPDTDPSFKDADSMNLLEQVRSLIQENGFSIGNVDITIIAEQPKLAPHVGAMKKNLADVLKIPVNHISIKAKTHEKIGSLGQGEGIAAISVALLYK